MKSDDDINQKIADIELERLEDAAKQTAAAGGYQYVNLKFFPIDFDVLLLIDEEEARKGNIAAISKTGQNITVAAVDPKRSETQEAIKALESRGFKTTIVVISEHSFEIAFKHYSLKNKKTASVRGLVDIDEKEIMEFEKNIKNIVDFKEQLSYFPASKILNAMLAGAIATNASDLHLEPEEKHVRLRYRLDGVLTDIFTFPSDSYHVILSRIKLTSGMMINVNKIPQDGRFTIRLDNKDVEVRVSVIPSAYGEGIVIRLLDPSTIRQKLSELGMREDTLELVKRLLGRPDGTILTTGPTGSGKTTTLYAFVQFLNTPDIKIITIEDPIEYHIEDINQTQTNEKAGYTFASGLRSIVRQDPDVILVGEIRDKETAEIAMQAALTGHLVLSTIHTNNAVGTIPRLIDLGVKPVTIAPALSAAMAQRLVRKLCINCRKKEKIKKEEYLSIKKNLEKIEKKVKIPDISESMEIYYPNKCSECNQTGYKGRIGVFEVFEVDNDMQKLILKSPAAAEIEELAVEKGLTTFLQDAFIKVARGVTSFEEVTRVLGQEYTPS